MADEFEYTKVKHKLTGEILLVLSQKGMGVSYTQSLRVRDYNYKVLIIDAGEVEKIKNEDKDDDEKIKIAQRMLGNIEEKIEEIYEDILCLKKDLDTTYSKMEEK